MAFQRTGNVTDRRSRRREHSSVTGGTAVHRPPGVGPQVHGKRDPKDGRPAKTSRLGVCYGKIDNAEPVLAGNNDRKSVGLVGNLDEIRVSNYAKRPFEIAASARSAAEATPCSGARTSYAMSYQ